MKKVSSFLSRKSSSNSEVYGNAEAGTPEGDIARGVRLFCESGGPNNAGEEVLHLPGIVDQAESSPSAAREAAYIIRKFLSKDNAQRPYVQYNAIMLMRILTDNPGLTFTRNLDAKFVATTKELLREGKDMSVQQILRETLDTFEATKGDNETLKPLITMWIEYKTKMAKKGGHNPALVGQPYSVGGGSVVPSRPSNHRHHSHRSGLPPPNELASRIEEARTSAKLLTQMVQSTPSNELLGNDLLKEFADRCQQASRSIQAYISAEDPAPDADTSLTLIETNDQLSMALSKHQRAVLQARKQMSPSPAANGAPGEAGASINNAKGPPPRQPTNPVDAPPALAIPQQHAALDNPFDDRNQAHHEEGRVDAGTVYAQPGQPGAQHHEEEESPQVQRTFRF